MSKITLRVGIIGTGGIAHGKHMPSLALCPEVEMVAFCDIIQERAVEAAAKFGTADAKVYTDYRELLADKSIDVVHICTPNWVHAEQTVAALEAGKHVMCEKPMAKTYAEAQTMLAAAKRTGKKLTIGYQSRHRPNSEYVKQMSDAGELGDIYFAKALAVRRRGVPTWGVFLDEEKQGGGPLIDIGTHALDLTLWLMNNYEWESVSGSVYKKLRGRANAANSCGPWDPAKYTVEDSAFGFIKFKDGATVVLESSWALNTLMIGEAKCVLCGTEAGVDFEDGLRINGERHSRLYVLKPDLEIGGPAFYEGKQEKPAHKEARRWVDAIINDTDPVVLPEQAAIVTQILEAIYTSAATGQPVYNK